MIRRVHPVQTDPPSPLYMPRWARAAPRQSPDAALFLAGSRLAMLDVALRQMGAGFPQDLFSNALALKAALATSKLEGRLTQECDIRDAYYLTPPDRTGVHHWGPDGEVFAFWRAAARIRLGHADWRDQVAGLIEPFWGADVTLPMDRDAHKEKNPIAAAGDILTHILGTDDRAERVACLAADCVLARAFSWERPVPLSSLFIKKSELRSTKPMDNYLERAIADAALLAFDLACDLNKRALRLRAALPRLRAKGSAVAVDVFLKEPAVAPSTMLSPRVQGTNFPMTDRAARRLCDRLVDLGVVSELTGRSTFRLYGVGGCAA